MNPADDGIAALIALLPLGRAGGLDLPDAETIRGRSDLRATIDLPGLHVEAQRLHRIWQPVADQLTALSAVESVLGAIRLAGHSVTAGLPVGHRDRLADDLADLQELAGMLAAAAVGLDDLLAEYDAALGHLADPMPVEAQVTVEIAARAELFETATAAAEQAVAATLDRLGAGGGDLALAGAR